MSLFVVPLPSSATFISIFDISAGSRGLDSTPGSKTIVIKLFPNVISGGNPSPYTPSLGGGHTSIKVVINVSSSGQGTLNNCWIGQSNSSYGFDGNQVRCTFNGGSSSVSLANGLYAANGYFLTSDAISFSPNPSAALCVAMDFAASSTTDAWSRSPYGSTQIAMYKKSGADAGTTTKSGYTGVTTGYSFERLFAA